MSSGWARVPAVRRQIKSWQTPDLVSYDQRRGQVVQYAPSSSHRMIWELPVILWVIWVPVSNVQLIALYTD